MLIHVIILGFSLGCILALSVGPVIFTIIKQSLSNGHVGGFSFVAGVWVSDIILVLISNLFSELVSKLLEHRDFIGYMGSVFLIVMGIYYLFFKKVTLRTEGDKNSNRFRKRDMLKIFSSGFFMNTLNPGVFLFWLGTATTFAKFDLLNRLLIFSICMIVNITADFFKVMLAGRLRKKLTLHNISVINKVSGVILAGFGIALLYSTYFLSDKLPV